MIWLKIFRKWQTAKAVATKNPSKEITRDTTGYAGYLERTRFSFIFNFEIN